ELTWEAVRHAAVESGRQWLLGSLVVGGVLGVLFGGLTFVVALAWRDKRSNWTGRARGGRLGNAFMKWVLRRLGLGPAYFLLFFIVPYFYVFAPRARQSSLELWSILRPESGFWERRWLVMKHLQRFATLILDRIYQSYFGSALFSLESDGFDNI